MTRHCRDTSRERPPVRRRGRTLRALSIGAALCGVVASELGAVTGKELQVWAEGPVQWLLLPFERKQIKQIAKAEETIAFIESFWQRRDQDPEDGANTFREEFLRRVEAADVLYSDEGVPGSLTDRGRALILMGPPTHVTVTKEPVMAWDPASNAGDRVTMRDVDVEVWGYTLDDLPEGLLQIWMRKKKRAAEDTLTLTLMFRNVGRRTSLVEGEPLLQAAARASVVRARD